MAIVLPTFLYENQFLNDVVVGVDEAGCGPWAGPVVAGVAVFKSREELPDDLKPLIRDSKTLSKSQRERAFDLLHHYEGDIVTFAYGQASPKEIDELNIAKASHLAMSRALSLLSISPTRALVDGNRKPDLKCPVQTIIKGDQVSISIAAASIVAKVVRDRIMQELRGEFPHYGWDTNAGYGTKIHQEGLKEHGVTEHHRRTYAPIARLVTIQPMDNCFV